MKVQSFQLAGNPIQAGNARAYTISPIFKHIIDCRQLLSVNCLWLANLTLIFDGIPHIIVQRCQIAPPKWPSNISSATYNAIFRNRAENIECSFGCVASTAVLLKPNVANILLSSIFVNKISFSLARQRSPLTATASPCSFSKKNGLIMPLDQNPHQTVTRFGCVGFSMYAGVGFLCPKCDNFACLRTRQDQNEIHLKR